MTNLDDENLGYHGPKDRDRVVAGAGLYDRVRLAREGSAVERCHTRRHHGSYTVGAHSLDVVMLVTLCWQADHYGELPSSALLVAAATHDLAERITGDVPQPIKAELGEKLAAVDKNIEAWLLGLDLPLTIEEEWYLKTADRVELWLWCWQEKDRGNPAFMDWVRDYDAFFHGEPPPPSFAGILVMTRLDDGIKPMDFHTQLKEIAGL